MDRARRDAACSITGGRVVARDLLGVTLAHEVGHSLHLRHIEDESHEAKRPQTNLMHVGLDLAEEGNVSGKPASPKDFSIEPFQYELARQYGRCAGRFRGAGPTAADDCPRLFEDLGLPGMKPAPARR
jgi:hypothetical protein